MAVLLTVVLTMTGALAGCSGSSPSDPPVTDTSALIAAIDTAEAAKSGVAVDTAAANVAVGTAWVTQAAWDDFTAAIGAAETVAANNAAAQAQVDDAATALTTATAAFNAAKQAGAKTEAPPVADKTALNAAISAAAAAKTGVVVNTAAANVAVGTLWVLQAAWDDFAAAIGAAETVAADNDAAQDEVDDAVTALAEATTAFNTAKQEGTKTDPPPVDKAALTAALAGAAAAKTGVAVDTAAANVAAGAKWVTQADMTVFETAVSAAQAVADNVNATQAQVDAAAASLTAAAARFNAAQKDGNGAAREAAAFTSAHGAAADKDAAAVAIADKAAVTAALTAYNALSAPARALLPNNTLTKLQALLDRIGALEAAAAFTAAHGAAVDKALNTVTAADKPAVQAAVEAYNALADGVKALLSGDTFAKLQALLAAIDAPEASAAFTAAHGATVNKDIATVTIADKAAISAAINAYNGLSAPAKALLDAGTLTKLQALLAKINGLVPAENIVLDFADDGALLDSVTGLTISKGGETKTLTVTAAAELMEIQWSLGGAPIDAPRGAAQSVTIRAADYPAGQYLLGLAAKKGAVVCSTEITFTVTE